MPISRKPKAVKDSKQGTAKVTIEGSSENPEDYDVLDMWSPDSSAGEDGDPRSDVKFIDGKSFWLPLYLYENKKFENNQTIKWDIEGSGFGFSKDKYTFGESEDIVFIEVSSNSSNNKKTTITIKDNDSFSKTIKGSAADNLLSGSDSNEAIYGRGGNDIINGGKGDDKLFGGYTQEDISNGADSSNDGNDTLKGGSGNDTLDGGSGIDIMYGGKGNDTYVVDSIGDVVTEYSKEGIDTVKSSVDFTLGNGLDNLVINGINGIGNALNNKIISLYSVDNYLSGGDGDDTLWGNEGYDILDGGKGNDSLYGGFEEDTLWGDFGKDYLNGGDGNDSLYGEVDNDLLDGWDGDDTLYGGAGNDTLAGDFGNDNLDGGNGNDALYGEDGTDRLNGYGAIITANAQFDTLTGGAGTDYFILGGDWGVSYVDDGPGYAIITDWNPSFDWIEVKGNASQYSLKMENKAGSSALDTAIYYGTNELIGVVQDTANVSITLDFSFV